MLSEAEFVKNWHRQSDMLMGYAVLKVGKADGYDLVSATYLRAWANRDRWNPTQIYTEPDAWIFRILTNLIRDYWRNSYRKVWPRSIVGDLNELDPLGEDGLNAVEDRLSENTFEDLLKACKKEIHRKVLRMSYVDCMTSRQIAEHIGISRESVKGYRLRAIRRIRESLKVES